jgi:hypothetical protein
MSFCINYFTCIFVLEDFVTDSIKIFVGNVNDVNSQYGQFALVFEDNSQEEKSILIIKLFMLLPGNRSLKGQSHEKM